MFNRIHAAIALAALVALPTAGCATAHEGYAEEPQILSELPANAPPGECYARVKVPGEPVGPPPMMMGAQWVMSPGAPGSPGPIWCLEPTGPFPVGPAPESVTRFGWIRVLCDQDATPARIDHIQHRLHDRGYYAGRFSDRYDAETVEAVSRFQASAHIEHGGYLSLQTVQALDEGDVGYGGQPPLAYAPPPYPVQAGYAGGYAYGPQAAASPCEPCAGYAAPPPPPPVVYAQPSYPVAQGPCCCGGGAVVGGGAAFYGQSYSSQSYYGGGQVVYGRPIPAYAARRDATIQNGWLVWPGKTLY